MFRVGFAHVFYAFALAGGGLSPFFGALPCRVARGRDLQRLLGKVEGFEPAEGFGLGTGGAGAGDGEGLPEGGAFALGAEVALATLEAAAAVGDEEGDLFAGEGGVPEHRGDGRGDGPPPVGGADEEGVAPSEVGEGLEAGS